MVGAELVHGGEVVGTAPACRITADHADLTREAAFLAGGSATTGLCVKNGDALLTTGSCPPIVLRSTRVW